MVELPEKVSKRSIPRWVKDYDYPERAEEIVSWLVSTIFWNVWEGKEPELAEPYVLERAVAEAHMQAVENTSDLEQSSHQATMSIVYTISTNEWQRFAEYDDLLAFLDDRLIGYELRMEERGGEEYPGSFYEVKNLMWVIKYLEQLGVPKEKVLGIRHNLSKAKTASGEMKKIASADISEKEKSEALLDVLDDVVNPEITVKDYRDKNKTRSIEQAKAHLPLNGDIYMVQGMEMVVIESPDRGSTKAIELSLNGLVDGWNIRDGASMVRHLSERVYTKQKFKPARIKYDGDNPVFKWGDGGYPMPTKEHLEVMILEEMGRGQRLIEQAQVAEGWCWLPLYNVGRGIKQTDLTEWISERFIFKPKRDLTAFKVLKEAVEKYYSLPEDLQLYYDTAPKIHLTWMSQTMSIDLRVIGETNEVTKVA